MAALGLALAVFAAGCGGGGSSTSQSTTTTTGGGAPPPLTACADGTVATYLGTSCSEGNTVYSWSGYSCTSIPSGLCQALGTNGSNIQVKLDPNGPYTLLWGATHAWDVAAGQSVDVMVTGTVYGAFDNQNWPHYRSSSGAAIAGQTGDGSVETITTVGCAVVSACTNSLNGVSDVLCDEGGPVANCNEQSSITPFNAYRATFNPAPSTSPYSLTVEIKLNGGTSGSANLWNLGTHLIPPGAFSTGSE